MFFSIQIFQMFAIQQVQVFSRFRDQPLRIVNLKDVNDDMQTQCIRTGGSTFDFKASVEGAGIVEGVLRYHPFLYETETYPKNPAETSKHMLIFQIEFLFLLINIRNHSEILIVSMVSMHTSSVRFWTDFRRYIVFYMELLLPW